MNYSIDNILGNYEYRYFGNGYKKISHYIKKLKFLDKTHYTACAKVSRCSTWSSKNSIQQNQHLTSIDAIDITNKIFSLILFNENKKTENYILYYFEIKTGTIPVENIEDIHVEGTIENHESDYYLFLRIGDMKIESRFLNYGDGFFNEFNEYKNITNYIENIEFDGDSSLTCKYIPESNLGKTNVYLASWLIVFAQLGEVLAFNLAKTSREKSNNFWVRKLKIDLNVNGLLKTDEKDTLMLKVIKNKSINKNNEIWHSFDMEGSDLRNLVDVSAKTALKE
ncbi:AvrD family protein [Fructilactobacillus carniphilus]|uniref:AvrD family protein n=1 Tax=Fructilactobacillus carniphilus TaxID=2940297 RepID=A0ABY5C0M3_9LACO|nr:AvrD family protein [Fructilactobacillus carniphilus]USS90820.1 AvrD family protein [Fructilactobacillus carniphilus]